MANTSNRAGRIKRATSAEMEVRAEFLIDYAREHHPVSVRGLYYQAEVAGLPGIDKTENVYNRIQYQVLKLRRDHHLPYSWISDATRYMRKPRTWNRWEDMLAHSARTYRRDLWQEVDEHVEVWCEKDALAGVIEPVNWEYDVPLMVSRGYDLRLHARQRPRGCRKRRHNPPRRGAPRFNQDGQRARRRRARRNLVVANR